MEFAAILGLIKALFGSTEGVTSLLAVAVIGVLVVGTLALGAGKLYIEWFKTKAEVNIKDVVTKQDLIRQSAEDSTKYQLELSKQDELCRDRLSAQEARLRERCAKDKEELKKELTKKIDGLELRIEKEIAEVLTSTSEFMNPTK